MKLDGCGIRNLRNIRDMNVRFTDGLNLIRGNNAQGKTTVLEAIYLFARGRSFRTNKEAEFISFDSQTADIEIEYEDSVRKNRMSAHYSKSENRKLFKNGVQINRTSEFIGNFRAVLFTPDHLSLIKNAGADRRLFLDVALCQITPSYIARVKTYNNLLTQRNALLKERGAEDGQYQLLFETIAEQMAPAAAAITVMRSEYCRLLDGRVRDYFDQMTGGSEKISTAYESCVSDDRELLSDTEAVRQLYVRKFTENIQREIFMKTSLYGPQKDDINIELNGYPSRRYCSQGQQRSLAIALKLAEGDISNERTGEYPVYLLDDISGELDQRRNSFFMSQLGQRQIIVTSCNMKNSKKINNVITIKNGEVVS